MKAAVKSTLSPQMWSQVQVHHHPPGIHIYFLNDSTHLMPLHKYESWQLGEVMFWFPGDTENPLEMQSEENRNGQN